MLLYSCVNIVSSFIRLSLSPGSGRNVSPQDCLVRRDPSSPVGLRRESPGYGDIDLQRKCSDTLEGFSPRTSGKRSRRKEILPAGK